MTSGAGPQRPVPSPRLASLAAEYQAAHRRLATRLATGDLPLAETPALLDAQLRGEQRLQQRLEETRRATASVRAEIELRRAQIERREEELAAVVASLHEHEALRASRAVWRTERRSAIVLRRRSLDHLRERSLRLERGELAEGSRRQEERLAALGRRIRECQAMSTSYGPAALRLAVSALDELAARFWSTIGALRCSPSGAVEERLAARLPPEGEQGPESPRQDLARRAGFRRTALRTELAQTEQAALDMRDADAETAARTFGALAALRWHTGELEGQRRWASVAVGLQNDHQATRAGQLQAFQTVEQAVLEAQADLAGQTARHAWISGETAGARAWLRLRTADEERP